MLRSLQDHSLKREILKGEYRFKVRQPVRLLPVPGTASLNNIIRDMKGERLEVR